MSNITTFNADRKYFLNMGEHAGAEDHVSEASHRMQVQNSWHFLYEAMLSFLGSHGRFCFY